KNPAEVIQMVVDAFKERPLATRAVAYSFGALLGCSLLQNIRATAQSSELLFNVLLALVVPLIFPASALLIARLPNPKARLIKIKEGEKQIVATSPLQKLAFTASTAIARKKNEFILFQYPFLSVIFASVGWVWMICWKPVGLGNLVAQWLGQCALDA